MKKIFYSLFLISICSYSFSQDFNLQFRSNVPYPGYTCSSCWGYVDDHGNEYALVGTSFGVSIVDITNPDNPVDEFDVQHTPSFWREIKTYGHYAYATNEDGGGLLVIDLSHLPDSIEQYSFIYTDGFGNQQTDGHELWIDEKGRLFIYGGAYSGEGATIFDLTADPINPPFIGSYENHYIHSGFVRGDTLWASEIFDGQVEVVNVADPMNPQLMATWHTTGNFTHNSWPTSDDHYLFTTDEIVNSYLTSYDVSDLDNVTELDKVQSTPGTSTIIHNVHLYNDTFAVVAYYCDGVVLFDVSHPDNMIKVGSYDTYPFACNGYNGTWGVYPYLPSKNLVVSNIEDGLFVLTPTYVQACRLEGVTTDSTTGALLNNVTVEILNNDVSDLSDLSGKYKTGIATAGNYSVKFTKAGYVTKVLNNISLANGTTTNLDVALVPSAVISLSGSVVDSLTNAPLANAQVTFNDPNSGNYTVTTDANGNFTINPFMTGYYDVVAGTWGHKTKLSSFYITSSINSPQVKLAAGYYDDFYFDFGWTHSGTATTGMWQRGEPVGTSLGFNFINPEYDVENDFGDQCYVTGNGGGSLSADDVDSGYTTLTTPSFDITSYLHPKISFYYYLGCPSIDNEEDSLIAFLYNGTDSKQTAVFTTADSPTDQWVYHEINIEDFLQPGVMTASFYIVDHSPENILEGAIDRFEIVGDEISTSAPIVETASSMFILPNPFNDQTSIRYDVSMLDAKKVSLQVMNSIGQIVREFASLPSSANIQLGRELPDGIYLLRLNVDGKVIHTEKAVKE